MTREKVYVLVGFLTFMTLVCSAIIWWFKRRGSKLAADCVKELESKEFVQLLTVGKNIPYIENLPSIEEKWMAPWIRDSEIILDHHYSCQKPLEQASIIVSDFDFQKASFGARPSEQIFEKYESATARYHQTVAIFANNDFNFPCFKLEPRSLCDFGILDRFRKTRINPELGPRFHRKYILQSSSGPAMSKLFTEKIAELLLSSKRMVVKGAPFPSKGMVIEGAHNFILIYRTEQKIQATEISDFAEKTTEIFKSLDLT
jgi:hypothetical protein